MEKPVSIFKFICIAILMYSSTSAQTPIVDVSINILPPYSPFLSDWQSHPERMIVTLTLLEGTSPVPVRLWVRLETLTGDVRIQTSDSYRPSSPEILYPGEPPRNISAQTLIDMYNIDNLVFHGTDSERIQRTGRLPDGVYRICFVVYHNETNEQLSGLFPVCSVSFEIVYYEPPTLLLPECGGDVLPIDLQTLIFSWIPPPMAPFTTNYTLKIVEVMPGSRNLNDAIGDATAVIFEIATTENYYNYSTIDPPLTPYRKYAWRVRASKFDEDVYFNNGGYSDIYSFHYGDSLGSPVLLGPSDGSTEPRPFSLSWNGIPLPDGGSPRYILKIMELAEDEVPPAELSEDPSTLLLLRNITEQSFSIERDMLEFPPCTRFAWQVREFDPRPENRFAFYNNGSSEVWICTIGRAFGEGGGDHRLLLDYPGDGDETVEETEARSPYFIAVFDSMSVREGGAGISIFDILMRDSGGDSLELIPSTDYMWRANIDYAPGSIREDGTICSESSTSGGPFFFTTIYPPGDTVLCNELPSNLIPQTDSSSISSELQIGGYTLVLDRPECTFDTDGRISGTGTVLYTDHGDWAVDFTYMSTHPTRSSRGKLRRK